MIEQLQGVEVQGKGFLQKRSFALFGKNQERVALVFGRNGTGKSTLAAAFKQLNPQNFDDQLSVGVLKSDGSSVPVLQTDESWKGCISVFDEKYINKTVRLKPGAQGIGTIVLFADLGDIDAQIEKTNDKLCKKRTELGSLGEKLKNYDDVNNACSPEYHINRMIESLKRTWADKDREVKGNVKKSQVNKELALSIAQMVCLTAKKDIAAEIAKCKADLSAVERVGDVDGIPVVNTLDVDAFDEKSLVTLLNQHIEKPELNEREKRIVALMETHSKRVDEVKDTFSKDETSYCPYCFRAISKEEKDPIIESIEKVLSREVEEYKNKLATIVFPQYCFNEKLYAPIDEELSSSITSEVAKCKEIVERYSDDVVRKTDNVFLDVVFADRELAAILASANDKIVQLERKRTSLAALAARRRKIKEELVRLYKEEAHHQIAVDYKAYASQLKEKTDRQSDLVTLTSEVQSLEQEVQSLEARKAGTDIAVGCINKSLQYIFVSDRRFTIEPQNGSYILKSRGHNVRPDDVSTGERHILALAYFFVDIMAQHSKKDFYKDERLIVIDDPVSSYDQENKIGVYSFLMRELENVLAGNEKSRVILFTHDIHTVFGMAKALEFLMVHRFKQQKYAYVLKEIGDDGSLVEFQLKHRYEYSCLLQSIYDFAKKGTASSHSMTIGNEMRRALEAYSTFLYRMDFLLLFRSELFVRKLQGLEDYFSARMNRIVFNGESHMQNQAKALSLETDFFAVISDAEKQQTAKDVLCLLYLLDENHVVSHFGANDQVVTDIMGWLAQLRRLNSVDCVAAAETSA